MNKSGTSQVYIRLKQVQNYTTETGILGWPRYTSPDGVIPLVDVLGRSSSASSGNVPSPCSLCWFDAASPIWLTDSVTKRSAVAGSAPLLISILTCVWWYDESICTSLVELQSPTPVDPRPKMLF